MFQAFHGHDGLVSRAVTNPHGNLVVSGGKDGSVRFWDIISGVCIRVLAQGLGEVRTEAFKCESLFALARGGGGGPNPKK